MASFRFLFGLYERELLFYQPYWNVAPEYNEKACGIVNGAIHKLKVVTKNGITQMKLHLESLALCQLTMSEKERDAHFQGYNTLATSIVNEALAQLSELKQFNINEFREEIKNEDRPILTEKQKAFVDPYSQKQVVVLSCFIKSFLSRELEYDLQDSLVITSRYSIEYHFLNDTFKVTRVDNGKMLFTHWRTIHDCRAFFK